MADVFRFPDPPSRPPKNIHRATLFRVVTPHCREMTCAAFDVETGLEWRITHGADDVLRSELFRGADADERLAERADEWRLAIIEKGFTVTDL